MTRSTPFKLARVALVMILPAIGAFRGTLGAQYVSNGPHRVTATVALVDRLNDPNARAIIQRRPNLYPKDVILLPAGNANGKTLAAAVASLLVARQRFGDIATIPGEIVVGDVEPPKNWDGETVRAQRIVDRLRQAQPRNVNGVGTVRATQIPLLVKRVKP